MSRRWREQQIDSPPAEHEEEPFEDHNQDDQLARELEEEQQKLLAASGNGHGARPDDDSVQGDHQDAERETDDEQELDDEEDLDADVVEEEDNSEDEWQPPEPASRSRSIRQSKRRRRHSSSEDSDDAAVEPSQSDEEPATKKSKKTAAPKKAKAKKANGDATVAKTNRSREQTTGADGDKEEAYNSFDEEAERMQAEVEAEAAWADVRRRKEAAQVPPSRNGTASTLTSQPATNKQQQPSAPSLTAWLGKGPSASSSVSELATSLPMPTTCTAAQIVDRSSLFIGYVYPLSTASSAYISALLSHLTRVVHPTVPTDLLPPQFASASANKRGSSHDMYAYRVFELKRDRTGLAGPDDFSLQEDKEDDGERWGGDRVLKVARDEGASDVLVIVSRWYGGELLGPVRFDHIENAARAAVQQHMSKEEIEEFRQRIQHLDRKIASTKAKLQRSEEAVADLQVDKYEDLTMERAQRLWLARQKALDALQKRMANQSAPASQAEAQQAEPGHAANTEPIANHEDALPTPPAESSAAAVEVPATDADQAAEAQDVAVKPEPEPEPPALDAASLPTEPPATDEPMPSTDTAPASQAEVPAVKPEPIDVPLTSLEAPIRIKDEEDTSLPPLTANHSQAHLNAQDQVDDKSNVKLEPTADDDGEDLTGWDDLS
ncbi:hypothetical protein NDA16_005080 [Ustilago loliicola]|nr:hypothetical protein NDA16_005080 [Ustilago loliicola]